MKKEELRLNVFLAQAGLCSRRTAEELIKNGDITINHGVVTSPSYKVKEKDTVRYKKQVVKPGFVPLVTIVMNKPVGVITSLDDEQHRETVIDLLDKKFKTRVYPIGRLDRNTSGVILLTNDGELSHQMAHPKFNVKKVYQVTLAKELSQDHFDKIKKGIHLKDGFVKVDHMTYSMQKNKIKVTIHSGRYRIVRRLFESFGYTVRKLDRINFGGVNKKGLAAGEYRFLSQDEIVALKKQLKNN